MQCDRDDEVEIWGRDVAVDIDKDALVLLYERGTVVVCFREISLRRRWFSFE